MDAMHVRAMHAYVSTDRPSWPRGVAHLEVDCSS